MEAVADTERIERLRALADELRAAEVPYPEHRFSGRGIVIVAGGALMFTNAFVLISLLRTTLRSRLPIEVWHFGGEEISPAMAALLGPFDVGLVDALPLIAARGARIQDGWQLKSFAMAWSRFEEVLLLDADQVPVIDPEAVFDWSEYAENGAVFWPDIVDIRADNPVWEAMGLEPERSVSIESGQLLVDKRCHWRALSLTVRLNEAANDLYKLIYGDKDTFLLGWRLAEASFALVPHRPFVADFFLVQRTFGGQRLFQHLTDAKWQYAGTQRRLEGFEHQVVCQAALDELREAWSGRVFNAPDRGQTARAIEAALIATRLFEMNLAGQKPIEVELRDFGEVGTGRDYDRRHWWVEEGPTGYRLILSDGQRRCYCLDRQPEGNWRGRRNQTPICEIDFYPVPNVAPLSETVGDAPGLVDDLLRASGFREADQAALGALIEALCLLSKVVPGASARLSRLADRTSDEEARRRLHLLREAISARSSLFHQDVVKDTTLLTQGYELGGGAFDG